MNLLKKVVLLGFGAAAACWAGPIAITNASFESPAQSLGGSTNVATGWTLTGASGVFFPNTGSSNGTNNFASVPDGNQILLLGGTAGQGEANQSLGISLAANTTYTLTYFVGQSYLVPLSSYSVALRLGSTTLVSDSAGNPGAGLFALRTISFTTGGNPAAGTLNIDILANGRTVTGGVASASFDAFSLSTPGGVPEPASIVLLAGGLLGVVLGRKRLLRRV